MSRLALIALLACATDAWAVEWDVYKSKHFVIQHRASERLAAEVARRAEGYYDTILQDLGYRRSGNFWLWDNRVTITLYPSRRAFTDGTQSPEWAAGKASLHNREISSYATSTEFLSVLLPHELTHFVFVDFIGFESEAPLWLHEGVAQWEEEGSRLGLRAQVRLSVAAGRFIPLRTLMALDVRNVDSRGVATMFYAQSASLVGYLIEQHGSRRFGKFLRQIRDGKGFEEALGFTYSSRFRTIDKLEERWRRHAEDKVANGN